MLTVIATVTVAVAVAVAVAADHVARIVVSAFR